MRLGGCVWQCDGALTLLVENEDVTTVQVDGMRGTETGHCDRISIIADRLPREENAGKAGCLHPPPTTMTLWDCDMVSDEGNANKKKKESYERKVWGKEKEKREKPDDGGEEIARRAVWGNQQSGVDVQKPTHAGCGGGSLGRGSSAGLNQLRRPSLAEMGRSTGG